MKKLFVGSLSYSVNDAMLTDFFAGAGTVLSATVIKDRDSGRSKGFGFVEMEDDGAVNVIKTLNNKELDGRAVSVSEAKPREERPSNGTRNGGGRGFKSQRNRY